MRYFRIPNFTGIEAHRDDADRGSLRVVEGCFPQGPGGMSSGPVWKKVGDVDPTLLSTDKNLSITSSADENGNAFLFASRNSEVHDIHFMPEPNSVLGELEDEVEVYKSDGEMDQRKAYFNSIGNRTLMIGEGSVNPLAVGKGPPRESGQKVTYDGVIYGLEWALFKRCKYFVVGPNKTIFAAGSCLEPLTVYVSEPAGLTTPFRDSPYSNNDISKVEILMSNATIITGLSVLNNQVVVHTDDGCHILYEPKPDQAETGYRVEQKPSSVFSAAVTNAVVNRACGSSPFWLGHDKSIYKDESSKRGQDEKDENTDRDQASYKSKGAWEHELPQNLENSFGVYDPFSGSYIVYVESEEHISWREATGKTSVVENDFICPADEDVPGSDATLIPHPAPQPLPTPVVGTPVLPPPQPEPEPQDWEPCDEGFEHSGKKSYPTPFEVDFNLGSELGEVTVTCEAYIAPDKFVVEFDGEEVINTGFISRDPDLGASEMGEAEGEPIEHFSVHGGVYTFYKRTRTPNCKVKVYAPGSGTVWKVKVSCPDPNGLPSDTESTTDCDYNSDDEKYENLNLHGTQYRLLAPFDKEWLSCIANYYNRGDMIPELHEIFDKMEGWGVRSYYGESANSISFNALYLPSGDAPNGGAKGVIIMMEHTVTGIGSDGPMEQFLESYRHESVHAAQDYEAAIGNATLSVVGPNGEIFNQHGANEVAMFYSGASQHVQDLELEANSAEIDIDLVRLAYQLAEN